MIRWWRSLPGWGQAVVIAAVSRAFSIAIVYGAWALHIPGGRTNFANPFAMWDGEWYLWIAKNGYHAQAVVKSQYGPGLHDFAFFPAWPILLRTLSLNGIVPIDTLAPILANLLFVVAAVSIYAVIERVGGRSIARWGLALLAFSPAAFIFSVAYSEPLFVVFVAAFFVAAGDRDAARSGLLAVLAGLTRVTGAALAFASLPDLVHRETWRQGVLVIAGSILAFGAWWTWIALLTGNPTGYMLGTPSWWENFRATPIPVGFLSFFDRDQWTSPIAAALIVLVTLGTRWLVTKGELRLAFFCFAVLMSTMLDTQTVMPRLLLIAFPAYAGMAAILPSARWRWVLLGAFAITQVVFGAAVTERYIVP
ncbi:MAG TPA: mannosyltransferase family protein [Candidatus Limnocylindrales bacterium]